MQLITALCDCCTAAGVDQYGALSPADHDVVLQALWGTASRCTAAQVQLVLLQGLLNKRTTITMPLQLADVVSICLILLLLLRCVLGHHG
jgi:hypothetical protein